MDISHWWLISSLYSQSSAWANNCRCFTYARFNCRRFNTVVTSNERGRTELSQQSNTLQCSILADRPPLTVFDSQHKRKTFICRSDRTCLRGTFCGDRQIIARIDIARAACTALHGWRLTFPEAASINQAACPEDWLAGCHPLHRHTTSSRLVSRCPVW